MISRCWCAGENKAADTGMGFIAVNKRIHLTLIQSAYQASIPYMHVSVTLISHIHKHSHIHIHNSREPDGDG